LEHLGTDHIDSYVLHGPSSGRGWTEDDTEVWQAMLQERDAGRTRLLASVTFLCGNLEQMVAARAEHPAFVQNRCYARLGWDREVRTFCRERKIVYQGFSLLTANQEVLRHPPVIQLAESLALRRTSDLRVCSRRRHASLTALPTPTTCRKTWRA